MPVTLLQSGLAPQSPAASMMSDYVIAMRLSPAVSIQ